MLSNLSEKVSVLVILAAVEEDVFWCVWCRLLLVTGTGIGDVLIHSAKIGFEITMAKSELGDSCKLVSGKGEEVGCWAERW